MKKNLSICMGLLFAGSMLSFNAFSGTGGVAADQAAQSQQVEPQTAVSGSCFAPNISYAVSDVTGAWTNSTTFVNVPDMTLTFDVPGALNTCVVVDFSATVWAATGELINVRALLDGTKVALPGEVQFAGDTDENSNGAWARAHNHQFVFRGVTPGTHTLSIQWRSYFGGTVTAHWRTVSAKHR